MGGDVILFNVFALVKQNKKSKNILLKLVQTPREGMEDYH